ncbi:MAG: condensation domain-containing protein, partial [Psychrosphaera sp.]|nr:condensation domain-containing protein [Psychrosphaera sp.]
DEANNLKIIGRKDQLDKSLMIQLKTHKAAIVEYLKSNKEAEQGRSRVKITPREFAADALIRPSFAQQRLWFIDQMEGGSAHYNMPMAFRFNGPLDINRAEQAFARIIERHESLRTVFVADDEQVVYQRVIPFKQVKFKIKKLVLNGQNIEYAQRTEAQKSFDLSCDLMLRVAVIELSEQQGLLLLNIHHIASDGWSMAVLFDEYLRLYRQQTLTPLEIQYADYALWQHNYLKVDWQLSYWQKQLVEAPPLHSLMLDKPRPKVQTFNGAMLEFELDATTTKGLKQLALSHNATLFMVLHGALSWLLSVYSTSDDILIGTVVANRSQKELEPLIGFFVNTLVLRVQCDGDMNLSDYINHIKSVNIDAQHNQDVAFESVVEALSPDRSTAYSPLFQIMFSMNTTQGMQGTQAGADLVNSADINYQPIQSTQVVAKFDLNFIALERDGVLVYQIEYNTDLFEHDSIQAMGQQWSILLADMVDKPAAKLGELAMFDKAMLETSELQNTHLDWQPEPLCIHQSFEQQVLNRPEAIALIAGGLQLTYSELNQQANRFARFLQKQGVRNETLVGICMNRSIDQIVVMLAILKAGGAYVPVMPDFPSARKDFLVSDSGMLMLITDKGYQEALGSTVCSGQNLS